MTCLVSLLKVYTCCTISPDISSGLPCSRPGGVSPPCEGSLPPVDIPVPPSRDSVSPVLEDELGGARLPRRRREGSLPPVDIPVPPSRDSVSPVLEDELGGARLPRAIV